MFGQTGGSGSDFLISLFPFIALFVIMYFLVLRPQQKRLKEHGRWSTMCAAATRS